MPHPLGSKGRRVACAALCAFAVASGPAQAREAYGALETVAAVGGGRCLEANGLGAGSVLGGESFLDACRAVTGQAWRAERGGGGRLHARLHGDGYCLALSGADGPLPAGTPYMASCGGAEADFARLETREAGLALVVDTKDGMRCLQARREPEGRTLRLEAALCDGRPRQVWRLGGPGGADDARVPDEVSGRSGECLWNDGTTDRPMQYPCRMEPAADASGFAVIGDDHMHRFTFEPDAPGLARGVLHLGRTERPAGRFERSVSEITCWTNAATGERLCFR